MKNLQYITLASTLLAGCSEDNDVQPVQVTNNSYEVREFREASKGYGSDRNAPCVEIDVPGFDYITVSAADPKGGCISLKELTNGDLISSDSGVKTLAYFVDGRLLKIEDVKASPVLKENIGMSFEAGKHYLTVRACDFVDNCSKREEDIYVFSDGKIVRNDELVNDISAPIINLKDVELVDGKVSFKNAYVQDQESGVALVEAYLQTGRFGDPKPLGRWTYDSYEERVELSDLLTIQDLKKGKLSVISKNGHGLVSEETIKLK
ncbi:MAG: hypothetical protein Q8Q35_02865 [Nanoarchaeota archaeon]|nr:hypothetical protein [Nanoarchaeota archaeon]